MKSLDKALKILNLFLNNQSEMSIGELSELSRVNKSTVCRIASVMVKNGYLIQKVKRGGYSLGTIFLSFYKVVDNHLHVRNIAIPHLVNLSHLLNEVTVIAYINGTENMLLEVFYDGSKNQILNVSPPIGLKIHLHSTSLGKIVMADLSDKDLQNYFTNKHIKQFTPNTIVDYNVMAKHLKAVRRDQVAFEVEEYVLGVNGLAAGIRDQDGKLVATIGIVAPSVRLNHARMQELTSVIKRKAAEIRGELGLRDL